MSTLSKFVITYIEPSGPPRNVQCTASGSRTAEIMWSPPAYQDQNGPIVYYLIKLADQWYSTDIIEINTTVSIQFTTVTNLEEYAQYSCQVAAATTHGVGPYSDAIFFTTFEDGMLCVHEIMLFLFSIHLDRSHSTTRLRECYFHQSIYDFPVVG